MRNRSCHSPRIIDVPDFPRKLRAWQRNPPQKTSTAQPSRRRRTRPARPDSPIAGKACTIVFSWYLVLLWLFYVSGEGKRPFLMFCAVFEGFVAVNERLVGVNG